METGKERTEMPYKTQKSFADWEAKNTLKFSLKFNNNTDADIIKAFEGQPSRQGFIKNALRYYIANGCPEVEKKGEQE